MTAEYAAPLSHARRPQDPATLAFAGVIGESLRARRRPLIRGLCETCFQQLLKIFFSDLAYSNSDGIAPSAKLDTFDEFDEIVELLLEHPVTTGDADTWLAYAIATTAMGDNHLWQDMGTAQPGGAFPLDAGSLSAARREKCRRHEVEEILLPAVVRTRRRADLQVVSLRRLLRLPPLFRPRILSRHAAMSGIRRFAASIVGIPLAARLNSPAIDQSERCDWQASRTARRLCRQHRPDSIKVIE